MQTAERRKIAFEEMEKIALSIIKKDIKLMKMLSTC
jgi:hypothetical protein